MKNISISFTLKSLLMGAFLGLFFTSFLPTKAYAATAEWKDNFNLTFEGDTYQSDNNDDNWYFYRLSDPDGCPDIINDISWSPRGAGDKTDDPSDDDTTAKLQKRSNTAVGCQDDGDKIDIDLSGHANATTGLVWDGEFIKETSDSPHVFQYDESIDAYVRQGDNSCQDSMVTNVGSGTATITIAVKDNTVVAQSDSQRTSNIMDVYSGHAWISQADYADTSNGCWISKTVTVKLGNTASATAPGSGSESGDVGSETNGNASDQQSCETSDLSWLLCPFLRFADSTFVFLDNKISDLLNTPDAYIANDGIADTWGRLRNLAYIILIPIMLLMVISTALGFEFVSAYTVKKAFPRLFLATIFIAFSYQICQFLIIFTNVLGQGAYGLLTGLVSGGSDITLASIFSPNGAQDGVSIFLGTLGIAGIATIVSLGVLFSYALTAVLIIMIGYFLLALRQMIIVLLVLLAPLAILAWIFPSNDKLWKLWWGSFWKLLLMYPLIMMLLGAGRIFAYTVDQVPGNGLMEVGLILLGFVAPYLFIPATFKFAGGAFGTITGMVNDRGRGIFDRNKKYRGQKMGQNFQNTKDGQRFGENNALSRRYNRVTGGLAMGRKGGFGLGERGKTQQSLRRQVREEQAMKENPALQKFVQTDDDGAAMLGLSGGTNQGLRAASVDLQNHWEQQNLRKGMGAREARVDAQTRATRAESAARSMGVNRANAGAALTGVAQNKARALEGPEAMSLVQKGAARMGGGNEQLESATVQGFMYHARGNGRQDLGHTDFEGAWDKQSIGAIVSGDTRSTSNFAEHIAKEWDSGDAQRMEAAAVKMAELQGALPGATEGNAKIINDLAKSTFRYDEQAPVGLEDQLAIAINTTKGLPSTPNQTQNGGTSGETIFKSARKYSKDTTEAERIRYQQEEMARRIAGQQNP